MSMKRIISVSICLGPFSFMFASCSVLFLTPFDKGRHRLEVICGRHVMTVWQVMSGSGVLFDLYIIFNIVLYIYIYICVQVYHII